MDAMNEIALEFRVANLEENVELITEILKCQRETIDVLMGIVDRLSAR